MNPDLVRSEVGRPGFPSTYDAKLLNIVGAYGTAASCMVLLRRCMAMAEHLKNNIADSTRVRTLEAQLEDALLEKDRVSKDFAFEMEQSRGQLKMLEFELSLEKAKVDGVEQRLKDLKATHGNKCKELEERLEDAEDGLNAAESLRKEVETQA